MTKSNDTKVVPSRLYTTASQKVEKQVEEELDIPDPSPEDALAQLDGAQHKRILNDMSDKVARSIEHKIWTGEKS